MPQDTEIPHDETNAAETGRITATVDAWKRKLLDLSRRNRALNFKPTKVSTITIVGFRHTPNT